jgi:hypothetical protein
MPTPRNAYEQGQLDARLDLQREGWGIDLDAPFEPEPLHDQLRRQMILLEAHGHGPNLDHEDKSLRLTKQRIEYHMRLAPEAINWPTIAVDAIYAAQLAEQLKGQKQ